MKEVLRLSNVSLDRQGSASPLRNYDLELYAGDVMVVSGLAGGGILGLLDLLSGKAAASEGRVEILERPAPGQRDHSPLWDAVYLCGDAGSQFDNLSVAENLALLSRRHGLSKLYSRERTVERAARYLAEAGIDVDPAAPMRSLSQPQRCQLSLLMARMAHAAVAVLDCTKGLHWDVTAGKLNNLLRRFSAEGMAFLLIAFQDAPYAAVANRRQRMAFGRDRMEWRWDFDRRDRGSFSTPAPQRLENTVGFLDEQIHYVDAGTYLRALREANPALWAREAGFDLPPAGQARGGGTALVPQDSAFRLAENLSVEDNLILTIPRRVTRHDFAPIPAGMAHAAARRFYEELDVDPEKTRVSQLSLIERKLLSVYRWEQAKPEALVLQGIFFGLDRSECARLTAYLERLRDRGQRVFVLTSSPTIAEGLCRRVIAADWGQNARAYDV